MVGIAAKFHSNPILNSRDPTTGVWAVVVARAEHGLLRHDPTLPAGWPASIKADSSKWHEIADQDEEREPCRVADNHQQAEPSEQRQHRSNNAVFPDAWPFVAMPEFPVVKSVHF
jgi:hypothetical protein